MKKKLISILAITILSLNTLFCNAVNISFEDLNNANFITENDSFEENNTPFEVTLNNEEDKKNMTQSMNLLSQNNLNISQPYISNNVLNSLNYTVIDLTDLATGEVLTHDCNLYLVSNFDENNHWQECSICGKVIGLEPHNYIDNGWTGGNANVCSESNIHRFVCSCGASYHNTIGRKTHTYASYKAFEDSYSYQRRCSICAHRETKHKCIKSNGTEINCGNPGKCSLCGYNYTAYHCESTINENGTVYCSICNKWLGTIISKKITYSEDGYITIYSSVSLPNGYTSLSYNIWNMTEGLKTISNSNKGLSTTTKLQYTLHKESYAHIVHYYNFLLNGVKCRLNVQFYPLSPDSIVPIINDIQVHNTENWSTDSTINITGTENYCNSVYLTLKDTNDNVYLENVATTVNNGNWNYEIKPNIEVKENTEFVLTVKDTLNNKTTQNFYLTKIDNKPPVNIGDKETSTNWSKTKDYIATTTDYGIGQVQNSVNDTENYELATEEDNIFYKGYIFTGNVYGSTLVPIYSKDGLGNTSTEFITVYNLDNTSPTIENVVLDKTLHSTNVTIQANDMNTQLNAEGSGVTGYSITTNNIKPTEYQESNSFTITKPKTYYVWVKDLVGNVTSKEMEIPVQYKVTINPDGGTWKGSAEPQEVILSSDEKLDLSPIPEKEGYTFSEWKVTGEGYITDDCELIITGSDVEVIPIWETNQYSVTYIDVDLTNNQNLNEITKQVNYDTIIRGFDLGNNTSDNVYYNQYRLVSDTESKVQLSNNIVYRYFEFCYTEKSSHLDFNDNDNIDNLRPETYKLQLKLEDGTVIDEVVLSSDVTDYTFEKLPKYDKDGIEYKYQIIPVISDRYKVTPNPETGEPEINYTSPEYSIYIPKITTLNGKNGKLDYSIEVISNLFYNDYITIRPDKSFILTDGIANLTANINQNKMTFTKEDILNNKLMIYGKIQIDKKHFAGTWKGIFNFNIKYTTQN